MKFRVVTKKPSAMVKKPDVIVTAATPGEFAWAGDMPRVCQAIMGRLTVVFCATGPGQVNTAYGLGHLLFRMKPGLILSTGIGGAYPASGLSPGDVAVATAEIDADWGVEPLDPDSPPGPISVPRFINPTGEGDSRINLSASYARFILQEAGGSAAEGTFVTTSTVTATEKRARALEGLYGAVCENMEGFAAAQIALTAGIPFAEVRGISNMAGPRDLSSWKIKEAVEAAGKGIMGLFEKLEWEGR